MRLRDALIVGIAQIGALIPGVSRSGSTLTAALFLNFKREEAARFSFLLGLPAIALAGLSRQRLGVLRDLGPDEVPGAVLHLAVRDLPRAAGDLPDRGGQHRVIELSLIDLSARNRAHRAAPATALRAARTPG